MIYSKAAFKESETNQDSSLRKINFFQVATKITLQSGTVSCSLKFTY